MKKIFKIISFVLFRRSVLLTLVVLSASAGTLWFWQMHSLGQFNDAYTAYTTIAVAQQNAAFVPGAANNPLRMQLNQTLEQVLAPKINAKDRLELAHHGLELIIQSNAEVDAIGIIAPNVQAASDAMESEANSIGNVTRKNAMLAIVALTKQQLYTIQDIRGLSYRANFDTAEIFNRIISDKGILTDSYIKDLNSQIPEAEKAFVKRQNSYTDLQKQMYDIQQKYALISSSS